MRDFNDGGPAFPVRGIMYDGALGGQLAHGMTLRDFFAAKALPEVLAQKDVHGHIREWENAAWISYQIADAMLKAREGET